MADRPVLYVHCPAFPIAVERTLDPALRGRPVVLAALWSPRATVLHVSSEARAEGVSKGMLVRAASRRCSGLRVLPPRSELYRRAEGRLRELASRFSPLVEEGKPGRLYLDLSGMARLFGHPPDLAHRLERELRTGLALQFNLGLAANKLVSRIVAKVSPREDLAVVRSGNEAAFLAPHPVWLLPSLALGCWRERLDELAVRRIGDLAGLPSRAMRLVFGNQAPLLAAEAVGKDDSAVCPAPVGSQVVETVALSEDSNSSERLLGEVFLLLERAAGTLRRARLEAGRVALELLHADHELAAGRVVLQSPTDLEGDLLSAAGDLLQRIHTRRVRVRRVRLTLDLLEAADRPRQLTLWESHESLARRRLCQVQDAVRARFGEKALRRGLTLFAGGTEKELSPRP